MRSLAIVFLPIFLGLTGCAFFKSKPPKAPPRPVYQSRTATLDVTAGIGVISSIELPPGFAPSSASPPMWLSQGQGSMIAVAGAIGQKAVVLGFGGEKFTNTTTVATDFGAGAPGGRILDVAASTDGMELATAVTAADAHRLDVIAIDSIDGWVGHTVASFDGDYQIASLNWLDRTTIAIVIHESAQATSTPATDGAVGDTASGLYVIGISGIGSIAHFDQVKCRLGRMSFSPDRRFAVSTGTRDVSPAIVDLHTQACADIREQAPIKVLGWAPDSSAFIYVARNRDGTNAGVFRFTIATARRTVVAVSSGAAAYASDGTIVAMGNSQLSWKRLARDPGKRAKAQIALLNPQTSEITLNSLGFEIPPAIFARSSMVYTTASDSAAIDTYVPTPDGLLSEIIEYSYPSRSAFVLASGNYEGPVAMSWSPSGRALAIVDDDASHATLTVLIPPR